MNIMQSESPTNDNKHMELIKGSAEKAVSNFPIQIEFVLVGLFFALLTIAALWPAPIHLEENLIGDYQGDFWKH